MELIPRLLLAALLPLIVLASAAFITPFSLTADINYMAPLAVWEGNSGTTGKTQVSPVSLSGRVLSLIVAGEGNSANRVTFVKGFNDNAISVSAQETLSTGGVSGATATTGWAMDITNNFEQAGFCFSPSTAVFYCTPPVVSSTRFVNATNSTFGAHFISGIERGDGVNTYSYNGANPAIQFLQVAVWQ